MNIRAATERDIPALQRILRSSWLTIWAPELALSTVQRFATLDPAGLYALDKWQEFNIVEDDGNLLGMFHIEGDHLNSIHLDPRHKRRRIGSLLMDEIERRIGSDYSEALLEVRAFNTGAIAFYKQRGWGVRRSFQSTECGEPVETLEMFKALSAP